MSLRIREVARAARVSTATVSRVLNNSPLVKPDTKEKVMEVIREMDYQPNVSALRLRQMKVSTVGVAGPRFVSYLNDNFYYLYGEIIRGIAFELGHKDPKFDLLLGRSAEADARAEDYMALYKGGKIGGAVVIFPSIEDPNIRRAREAGMPVVYVGTRMSDAMCVDIDNRQGITETMKHLFAKGHTRIAMLNGRRDQTSYADRKAGYREALEAKGLPLDESLYIEGMTQRNDSYEATVKLLEQKPTAIVCATDMFAGGAEQAIRDNGLRIPEDIAVTGFDGTPGAAGWGLTTVKQPLIEMGRAAVNMLIDCMEENRCGARTEVLPCELIIRKSTDRTV